MRRYDVKTLQMFNERIGDLAAVVERHIQDDWEFVCTFGSAAETLIIMRRETKEYLKKTKARSTQTVSNADDFKIGSRRS
jgi:hypothetical protein